MPYLTPRPEEPISFPVQVTYLFYMKTKRVVDKSNLTAAADDMLVEAGILEDDNSRILVSHDGTRVLYDKDNPRTEITITAI
jgi:Holliday junction resolvase RusA-like endonuclease